jgi:hypothetical protein
MCLRLISAVIGMINCYLVCIYLYILATHLGWIFIDRSMCIRLIIHCSNNYREPFFCKWKCSVGVCVGLKFIGEFFLQVEV